MTLEGVLKARNWRPRRPPDERGELVPWSLDTALRLALDLVGIPEPADLAAWRAGLFEEGKRRLFPGSIGPLGRDVDGLADVFFPLAGAVVGEQAARGGEAISVRMPFSPLDASEIDGWPSGQEYRRLLAALDRDGLLVTLAMAQQWCGFSIADHVLGVTGLCLWIGRQLGRSVGVDLPLLHGAAVGHDVGKFGCRGDEERRIPWLHYFYTHVWYRAHGLPGLGHIATNHSCWDLEQVRLPMETQLLIYADFRVKDGPAPGGGERMALISLKQAFGTIRDKLADLDEAKLRRYEGVYRKLVDLEDYLLALGVRLDPPSFSSSGKRKPAIPAGIDLVAVMAGGNGQEAAAVASGREIPTTARLFATAHNLGVMERLRDVPALRALLEEARSFERWRDLRTYVGVLGEYGPALSMEQKELALDFFFELLGHRDDDIRYHASNRIGDILSLGEDFWRKDLPAGVTRETGDWVFVQLGRVLGLLDLAGPDVEEDFGDAEAAAYAVPVILRRFMAHAGPELRDAGLRLVLARLADRMGDRRPLVGLYVCETLELLLPHVDGPELPLLIRIAGCWVDHDAVNTRLMAWRLLVGVGRKRNGSPEVSEGLAAAVEAAAPRFDGRSLVAELTLAEELAGLCGLEGLAENCRSLRDAGRTPVQEVLLRNLKSRVGWVEKKVNCDFLVETVLARGRAGRDREAHFANEVAVHMANLLKVSRVEGTRFHAGRCLVRLLEALTVTQRNDVMVELLRSLQLDVEAVARYIPRFLAAVIVSLPEQEFLEALDDIESNVQRGAEALQRLLLQTTMWVVVSIPKGQLGDGVLRRLAGVLLGALTETRAGTVHEAYAEISILLDRLSRDPVDDRLSRLLRLVTKKLLTLVAHRPAEKGRFFLVASVLNQLDRALFHARPRVRFPGRPSLAFIPGTFDPFTKAHLEIVTEALSHADEVLVQVDDYSWNKHSQPRRVREGLALMALARIPAAFVSPFEPPVNLANPDSLILLERRVRGRGVTVVVGSDVLAGASAYADERAAIWDLPHLVVVRGSDPSRGWEDKIAWFRAPVRVVSISARVRSVSSTSLRLVLDQRGDPEAMCEPLVARTLHERQLYVNYPSRKEQVTRPRVRLEVVREYEAPGAGLSRLTHVGSISTVGGWARSRREMCMLSGRDSVGPLAGLGWREVAAAALPVMLEDPRLAEIPGDDLVGRGALIEWIAGAEKRCDRVVLDALLSKVMERWLNAGLLFVLVGLRRDAPEALWPALHACGAGWLTPEWGSDGAEMRWAAIRLDDPQVLLWDMESVLQPLFGERDDVRSVVGAGRRAIAEFFAGREPGAGLFHLNEREVKREVAERARGKVREAPSRRRWVVLGLGRRFSRDVVADSPTLAIELERFLTWQGYEGGVHASPGSPSLDLQLHTVRELGSDALLLAPVLEDAEPVVQVHKAALRAGVALREVLVGVTSAPVHATLHLLGIKHSCAVIVPHWRAVVRESALTPYVGGWTIAGRSHLDAGSLLPSLNDCLPYHHPHALGHDSEAALDFSRVALGQARGLFECLERIFRGSEGRLLSLYDLGMVVRTPRCPPMPEGFAPPRGRVPSQLLGDDLEALARLHPERHAAHRQRWRGV